MDIKGFLQQKIDGGLSRSDIARRLGVNPSNITRWIGGETPSPRLCHRIAEEFGLPVATVLQMAGHAEALPGGEFTDPEWEVMQRELKEVYASWDRSHWHDLLAAHKAVASLAKPAQHGSTEDTPQSSRFGGNYAVPEFAA